MMPSVSDMLLRLDGRWSILSSTFLVCWGVFASLYGVVVKKGGISKIREWVVGLESEKRGEAKSRISSGLDLITKNLDHDKGCNELLGGLDQWRASQNKSRKRLDVIASAPRWVLFGLVLVFVAWASRMLEPEHSFISVVFGILSLLLFGWVLIGVAPLLNDAFHRGLSVGISEEMENISDEIPVPSSVTPVQPQNQEAENNQKLLSEIENIRQNWRDEQTVYGLKPLLKDARLKLTASVLSLPKSDLSTQYALAREAMRIERMKTSTDEEWKIFAAEGTKFLDKVVTLLKGRAVGASSAG